MSLWCDDFYVTPQGYYVIKVITGLLHQGISRLLCHGDVDQSQTVSKSADFTCEKMHFCSSESRESRIFGISTLKTIVLKNKTKLFFRPATGQLSADKCGIVRWNIASATRKLCTCPRRIERRDSCSFLSAFEKTKSEKLLLTSNNSKQ